MNTRTGVSFLEQKCARIRCSECKSKDNCSTCTVTTYLAGKRIPINQMPKEQS